MKHPIQWVQSADWSLQEDWQADCGSPTEPAVEVCRGVLARHSADFYSNPDTYEYKNQKN